MATIHGDITGLRWLNPTETPLDALLKGAQTGNLLARAMQQRQALDMQAAMLPSQIQALATKNKFEEAQLQEQWLKNQQANIENEAWMTDRSDPAIQAFMSETNPNATVAADIPFARSAKAQLELASRHRMAAQSTRVIAQQKQYADREAQATKIMNSGIGLTPTPVKDAYGQMTYNPQELARLSRLVEDKENEDKLMLAAVRPTIAGEVAQAIAGTRAETALEIAGIRQDTAIAVATMNNATEVEKFLSGSSQLTPAVRANLKAMQSEFKVLETRAASMDMKRPSAQAEIANETARIQKKYAALLASPTPGAVAAPAASRPVTQTEYNALPSGSRYLHPSGQMRTKQ